MIAESSINKIGYESIFRSVILPSYYWDTGFTGDFKFDASYNKS